ncbi:hypothetical protein X797_005795 [Metarhizium robertsii]|uniref:Uncharacterized protein n=1 Tax=Metarhizium robertsii TaxID=568076 RepID=A0A014N4N9_9HYPO|nr:hypothetical protein X797_005795 [Metarhizium robertsii]
MYRGDRDTFRETEARKSRAADVQSGTGSRYTNAGQAKNMRTRLGRKEADSLLAWSVAGAQMTSHLGVWYIVPDGDGGIWLLREALSNGDGVVGAAWGCAKRWEYIE